MKILELQNAILEMIARGEPLVATLDQLCKNVEVIAPGIVCSVLEVCDDRLHSLAAPSLPDGFSDAIEGLEIGPLAGSCGTAAYLGQSVTVTDIATDARWDAFRGLALPLGLLACWSTPITINEKVVATFAFYYREKRGPNETERQIVDACVHLCAIGIERNERVLERERLTYIDALTDLPNRAHFNKSLNELHASEQAWGILIIDVDNLKLVNDTFGHAAGDALIKSVGERASQMAGADSVFRLGGDEFAIIARRKTWSDDLTADANKILAALAESAQCAGHVVFPKATIGGAVAAKGDAPEQVLQNADIALYHAKERGRGHYVEYYAGLGTAITRRFRAIRDVGVALKENRLHAYYQPIVRLDTREIVGFEALCRMVMPSGQLVSAANFHEATKDAQVASELTQHMMEQVARDIRCWLDRGLPLQHVGINLSAADLQFGNLQERIAEVFTKSGVSLQHIILEITESVYFGQGMADQVKQLRSSGLRVALDDFGTGFASLTHLLTVPADIIKIDKSFIDRLTPADPAVFIVDGIIGIARKLGMRVVAEGIENEAQVQQLRELGCMLGQGYLFSRAVDSETAATLLEEQGQRLSAADLYSSA